MGLVRTLGHTHTDRALQHTAFPFLHQFKLGKVNHIFKPPCYLSVVFEEQQVKEETEFTNISSQMRA